MTFDEFGLDPDLLSAISAMGFKEATPIQQQAIPLLMEGKDMIACAQTGTGKTAAYLLPILNACVKQGGDGIKAMVIVPTRELAQQIDQQLQGMAYFLPVSSIAMYGGGDGAGYDRERKALEEGADVIVATPGKLLSHLRQSHGDLSSLGFLVLDEADRMLDMGFIEDIMEAISYLPPNCQKFLFSATMPPKIRTLANKILKDPAEISIAVSKPAEGVVQVVFLTHDHQKTGLIEYLLRDGGLPSVIVFSSTKKKVKEVEQALKKRNLSVKAIHSDLEQPEREEVLRQFRNRKVNILVATDILSRGIDIESIDMVINYDAPHDAEDYVHRIGRTARASSQGEAVTFVNETDMYKLRRIEQLIGYEIRRVPLPEHLGEGPVYQAKRSGPPSQNQHAKSGGGKKKFFRKGNAKH